MSHAMSLFSGGRSLTLPCNVSRRVKQAVPLPAQWCALTWQIERVLSNGDVEFGDGVRCRADIIMHCTG